MEGSKIYRSGDGWGKPALPPNVEQEAVPFASSDVVPMASRPTLVISLALLLSRVVSENPPPPPPPPAHLDHNGKF